MILLECSGLSTDAICGLLGAVIGAVLAFIFTVVWNIIYRKIGNVIVKCSKISIDSIERNDKGYITCAKAHMILILYNNKNIPACFFNWKILINKGEYAFELKKPEDRTRRGILVVTSLNSNSVTQIVLEEELGFELYAQLFHEQEYSGIDKIESIESVILSYECNFKKDIQKIEIPMKDIIISEKTKY